MFSTIVKLRLNESLQVQRTEAGAYVSVTGYSPSGQKFTFGVQVVHDQDIEQKLPEALTELRKYTKQLDPEG